jgi:anti-sigma-K factor RskA
MNKEESEKLLDDQLAEFTDQVLSDGNEMFSQETDEMAELQKTVIRMKSAAQAAHADSEAKARIRSRVMMEWKKTQQAKQTTAKRFNWNWNMPRLAFASGLAILILIGVVTLLPPTTTPLTATADGSHPWSPFLVIAGIIIIVYILWRNRHD